MAADAGQTVVSPLVDGQNYVITERLRPSALPVEQSVAASVTDDIELREVVGQHIISQRNDGTALEIHQTVSPVASDAQQGVAIGCRTVTVQTNKSPAADAQQRIPFAVAHQCPVGIIQQPSLVPARLRKVASAGCLKSRLAIFVVVSDSHIQPFRQSKSPAVQNGGTAGLNLEKRGYSSIGSLSCEQRIVRLGKSVAKRSGTVV